GVEVGVAVFDPDPSHHRVDAVELDRVAGEARVFGQVPVHLQVADPGVFDPARFEFLRRDRRAFGFFADLDDARGPARTPQGDVALKFELGFDQIGARGQI